MVCFDGFLIGRLGNVEYLLSEPAFRLVYRDLPRAVNIGNLHEIHEIRALDLVGPVIELCGADVPISFVPRLPDDPAICRPDIRLARERPSQGSKTDLRGGLTSTIAELLRLQVEIGRLRFITSF